MTCSNNASGHTVRFCGIKVDKHMVLGSKKIQILHGVIRTVMWHRSISQHSKDALDIAEELQSPK